MTSFVELRKKTGASLRVSKLIPGLLLLAGLSDFVLRLFPPGVFTFRAWEAMTLFVKDGEAFSPVKRYENERSYGDLSNIGNLPKLRQYHREVFTTDTLGFRNLPIQQPGQLKTVLIGDSFAAGSGVSDEDTLSQQLARLQASPVYNAARNPQDLEVTCRDISNLDISNGLVIWELFERAPIPQFPSGEIQPQRTLRSRLKDAISRRFPNAVPKQKVARKYLSDFLEYSPLSIEASRAYRVLQNDLVLPNTYKSNVAVYTLTNGASMLFIPQEIENYHKIRSLETKSVTEMKARLNAMGLRLLVLLVPGKYTVYYPLLRDAPASALDSPLYTNRLEASLRAAGIDVVNLTAVFRKSAAEALARGEYIYWLDDTHWTPSGIRIAAEELRRWM